MGGLGAALLEALDRLLRLDAQVVEIVALSLRVSLTAVLLGTLLGLPLGACLAVGRFPGKQAAAVMMTAMMGHGGLPMTVLRS